MKLSKKFRFLAASVLALQLTVPLGASAENKSDNIAPSWVKQADYVALGDSLVHGMNEVGAIGLSYADFVAQALQRAGLVTSYNKGFAYSGYTTQNVLADLRDDVEKPVTGFGYPSDRAKLRDSIRDAELITLTIGANDLLPLLEEMSTTSFDTITIFNALQEAVKNIGTILEEIKKLNLHAKIYVMGYYNAFPYANEALQTQIKLLLGVMNTSIKTTAERAGAIFVPTFDVVAKDVRNYLPNPENIHLSEAGYSAVADQAFLPLIKASSLWDASSAIQVNAVSSTVAQVNWQAASDNEGVTKYNVYVNNELYTTVDADQLTVTLDDLSENTVYTVAIKALDAAGNESVQSPTATFTTGSKN